MAAASVVFTSIDIGLSLIQAYAAYCREHGMTDEQAKERFLKNYPDFMAESAQPVDPVKP